MVGSFMVGVESHTVNLSTTSQSPVPIDSPITFVPLQHILQHVHHSNFQYIIWNLFFNNSMPRMLHSMGPLLCI